MTTSFISCPSCQKSIALDEVYSQKIREELQKDFEVSRTKLERDFAEKSDSLADEKLKLQETLQRRVAEITAKVSEEAEIRAKQRIDLERQLEKEEFGAIKVQALESKQKELAALKKAEQAEEQQRRAAAEAVQARQELERRKQELNLEAERLEQTVMQRVSTQTEALKVKISEEANQKLSERTDSLQQELTELRSSVANSREREMDALQKVRQAEEKIQTVDLEIQRRVTSNLEKVRQQTLQTLQEEQRLKDLQNEREKDSLRKTIDELKRRMDQGSQQAQGEILELDLEQTLRTAFPTDRIIEVPKGQKGADVIHKVYNSIGKYCGSILWESKRTKAWSDGWLAKLKEDQVEIKADAAVLLSIAMPRGIASFTEIGGVVVTSFSCYLPVAAALRKAIVQVANAKAMASAGNETKELIYKYLTGNAFPQHVQAIVEIFQQMVKQIQDEKIVFTKQWAVREKQAQRGLMHLVGIYGDIQGLAGSSIPAIDGLELKSIAGFDEPVGEPSVPPEPSANDDQIPF
jgi:hypothetical protein